MISAKTLDMCQVLLARDIQELNNKIAERTGRDPDVVDTQWFEDKQRHRDALLKAHNELRQERRSRA